MQIHRWTGLIAGLYIVLIGITGSAVVFRQEMQAAMYPEFFRLKPEATNPMESSFQRQPQGPGAFRLQPEVSSLVRELKVAYPGYRLSGIDWPTYRRATFLAYMTRGSEFRTVFAHPVSGRVTGELPSDWIGWLQDLHFNLMAGRTGRIVNGIGALSMLVMGLTGLMVWWRRRWSWHERVGVAVWPLIVMWGLTGVYFAFPQPFRSAINAMSALTALRAPESGPTPTEGDAAPLPDVLVARAQQAIPGAQVARLVLPATGSGAVLVLMARGTHGDHDTTDEVSLFFDQHTGKLLQTRDHGVRSAGDTVMAWIGPLHFGSFGGLPVKLLWALGGLALPLLFVTGTRMWWNRRAGIASPSDRRVREICNV